MSSAGRRRGGSLPGAPRREESGPPGAMRAPPAQAVPGLPPAPARRGRAPGSERAAAQVGASWGLTHASPPAPRWASRPTPTPAGPCAAGPAEKLESSAPGAFLLSLPRGGLSGGGSSLPPRCPLVGRKRNSFFELRTTLELLQAPSL